MTIPICPFTILVQAPCNETVASWMARQGHAKTVQEIADHFQKPVSDIIKEIVEYAPDPSISPWLGFGFMFKDISVDDIKNGEIKINNDTLVFVSMLQLGEQP